MAIHISSKWQYISKHGNIWVYVHDNTWVYMVMHCKLHGNRSAYMTVYRYIIYGKLKSWKYMIIDGHNYMVIHGYIMGVHSNTCN